MAVPDRDMTEYHFYVELISSSLFDSFTYKLLETHTHVAWKEYFHGMYEICVMPKTTDRVCWQMTVNSCFQNFDLLPVPVEMPPETDKLHNLILYIRDLFDHLKGLHQNFVIPDLSTKLCENVADENKIRCEMVDVRNKMKKLARKQARYTKMLL